MTFPQLVILAKTEMIISSLKAIFKIPVMEPSADTCRHPHESGDLDINILDSRFRGNDGEKTWMPVYDFMTEKKQF